MKKPFVIHHLLFAIFPILFLFTHNIGKFPPSVVTVPMAITTCFALLSWSVLNLVLKDKQKAGLLVSLFVLLFFSYGHFYNLIKDFQLIVGGFTFGPNKILYTAWCILSVLGAYSSIRTHRDLGNLTTFLNIVAASLVMFSLVNIGAYMLRAGFVRQEKSTGNIEGGRIDPKEAAALPHIYYIILDGYARADILREIYQYDNTEMGDYLTQKGFYIADRSRSNYAQTALSLASSLNFEYLDDLVEQIGVESDDRAPLRDMIRDNKVVHFLRQHGYLFVAFSSGYSATEITNADVYMTSGAFFDEFQNGLINTTPISAVLSVLHYQYDLHRRKILYTFDHLVDFSETEEPVFVFAHILAPHPPFVFGRHGEEINPEARFSLMDWRWDQYEEDYIEQLIFINGKVRETIDGILSRSARPVIIILQADHGPGSTLDWGDPGYSYIRERMSILNAYLLTNNGNDNLYDDITPVNTFRIIFNDYFNTDYELLDDESYISTWDHPYKLINVTDKIDSDINARLER